MATHGYTVVAPYHYLSSPDTNYAAKWLTEVISWVKENLASKLGARQMNSSYRSSFKGEVIKYTYMFLLHLLCKKITLLLVKSTYFYVRISV